MPKNNYLICMILGYLCAFSSIGLASTYSGTFEDVAKKPAKSAMKHRAQQATQDANEETTKSTTKSNMKKDQNIAYTFHTWDSEGRPIQLNLKLSPAHELIVKDWSPRPFKLEVTDVKWIQNSLFEAKLQDLNVTYLDPLNISQNRKTRK